VRLWLSIFDGGRRCSECVCDGSVRCQYPSSAAMIGKVDSRTVWFSKEIQLGIIMEARVKAVARATSNQS
jgi:hypothetical protein